MRKLKNHNLIENERENWNWPQVGQTRILGKLFLIWMMMKLCTKKQVFFLPMAILSLVLACFFPVAVSFAKEELNIKKGVFLVANPVLQDPYFKQSVILLIKYNGSGATGLIINKPTNRLLSKVLPKVKEFENSKDFLYLGGPLKKNSPFFLIKTNQIPKKSIKIFDNIYCSYHIKFLSDLGLGQDSMGTMRIYGGYAGWLPGQLESEIMRGSWKIVNANADTIFKRNPEGVWEELIKNKGKVVPEGLMVMLEKNLDGYSSLYFEQ